MAAKAYVVGNPRGKKKKKAPSAKPKIRKKHVNPLEMVITGAGINPHRKGKHKMAAKRKRSKKARSGNPHRKGSSHNKRRRARRFHNPLLPVEAKRLPGLLLGGAGGGVVSVWVPNLLLGAKDVGIFGYLLNALTAVLGAWALGAMGFANAALGFLVGGGVAIVGRVIDDYTGKQIIQFSAPMNGMGQFYRGSQSYLPSQTRTDLTDYRTAALPPAVITAGQPAMAKAKAGMGWAAIGRRRVA
jgi:hypothetical protein